MYPILCFNAPKARAVRTITKLLYFRKNRGYTNPFDHLVACYKSKPEIFSEVQSIQRIDYATECPGTSIITEREEAMYAYLNLVFMRNAPVCIVEDDI